MKQIVKKAITGIVLTTLIYLLACLIINRTYLSGKRAACWINSQYQRTGGQEHRICRDWLGADQYDILVIGSSHAYRGYDPRVFEQNGLSMYTAGSGFQNTLATYVLLKDIFTPKKNMVVVIDLFDLTFEGDGIGCYARLIQNVNNRNTAAELAWRQPDVRTFNSFMCRVLSDNERMEVPDEPGYLFNGYCPKPDTTQILGSDVVKSPDFNPRFFEYLREAIRLVKSQGGIPIAVSHPQPKTTTNLKFHDDFLKLVMPIIKEEGVLYLDYNTQHPLNNNEHFADANHLNQAGVNLFNEILLTELHSRGILSK